MIFTYILYVYLNKTLYYPHLVRVQNVMDDSIKEGKGGARPSRRSLHLAFDVAVLKCGPKERIDHLTTLPI